MASLRYYIDLIESLNEKFRDGSSNIASMLHAQKTNASPDRRQGPAVSATAPDYITLRQDRQSLAALYVSLKGLGPQADNWATFEELGDLVRKYGNHVFATDIALLLGRCLKAGYKMSPDVAALAKS